MPDTSFTYQTPFLVIPSSGYVTEDEALLGGSRLCWVLVFRGGEIALGKKLIGKRIAINEERVKFEEI